MNAENLLNHLVRVPILGRRTDQAFPTVYDLHHHLVRTPPPPNPPGSLRVAIEAELQVPGNLPGLDDGRIRWEQKFRWTQLEINGGVSRTELARGEGFRVYLCAEVAAIGSLTRTLANFYAAQQVRATIKLLHGGPWDRLDRIVVYAARPQLADVVKYVWWAWRRAPTSPLTDQLSVAAAPIRWRETMIPGAWVAQDPGDGLNSFHSRLARAVVEALRAGVEEGAIDLDEAANRWQVELLERQGFHQILVAQLRQLDVDPDALYRNLAATPKQRAALDELTRTG